MKHSGFASVKNLTSPGIKGAKGRVSTSAQGPWPGAGHSGHSVALSGGVWDLPQMACEADVGEGVEYSDLSPHSSSDLLVRSQICCLDTLIRGRRSLGDVVSSLLGHRAVSPLLMKPSLRSSA